MGGMNSSRWGGGPVKCTTDRSLSVDIRQLKRTGKLDHGAHLLTWPNGSTAALNVNSDATTARFQLSQQSVAVSIEYTDCHFGGSRPWFVCDCCGSRYAVLYFGKAGIACRGCNGLLYPSQKETDADRAIRKAQRLGIRLGFGPNLINGEILNRRKGPPKHMHQHTYDRLLAQYINARTRAFLMV